MSALTLVAPVGRPTAPPCPVAGPCPVQSGDQVHVPEPVALPCGRRVRRGAYTVLRTEWCSRRRAWRLVVEARLDCSHLPTLYHPPTPEMRERARVAGEPAPRLPLACEPARVYLDAGEWTAYADADGPTEITARSRALDG